ncbi:hypothetical protein AB0H76_11145 [Nocardia sp. NPDC050712]|uniref:hypothetical protein n=1 Tax=Nocardia sp. NPDC050712 TaxID=3155518 RepID=UPI0033CD6033
MGARSFLLAARIPMPENGFDEWLGSPMPSAGIIENPEAMYTGWAAAGTTPDWSASAQTAAGTPLQLLATAGSLTLARYRDGALEVYLYHYHDDPYIIQTELLMLAGAGRFTTGDAPAPVLYWGGDVYPGLPLPGDQPLAVLLVGPTGARFVDRHPLAPLLADLRTAESDFLVAGEQLENQPDWTPEAILAPAVRAAAAACDLQG